MFFSKWLKCHQIYSNNKLLKMAFALGGGLGRPRRSGIPSQKERGMFLSIKL